MYSFGRGVEGQLGHCNERIESSKAKLISSLSDEMIVSIAAGSLTSYAVTLAGDVYHWGNIHKEETKKHDGGDDIDAVQSGQLTGMAGDQDDFIIVADLESRALQQQTMYQYDTITTNNTDTNNLNNNNNTNNRDNVSSGSKYLRNIVGESIERWQLPTDNADREYYRELLAMGYENEGS